MNKNFLTLALLGCLSVSILVSADEGAQGARKHMVRGIAAIEIAKTPGELQEAADEFRRATELDPSLANAWFNLGSLQTKLGQYGAAITSYQRYLKLSPNAEDAQKIQDEIIKIEFLQERVAKTTARLGTWVAADGTPYRLTSDGNHIVLETDQHAITDNEAEGSVPLVGKMWIKGKEQVKYDLQASGTSLTGTWKHSPLKAYVCTIPEESGEVSGEIRDSEKTIIVRHTRMKYMAKNGGSLFGDDYCEEVKPVEKKNSETLLRGPLPNGGIMAILSGINWYWPGGFSAVELGWTGNLGVSDVNPNSPAFTAGLRAKDKIVSINGVEVKTLSTAQEAILLLRGEAGSEVILNVIHEDQEQPVSIRFKRVKVPGYVFGQPWIN
ncbi:PDZ domain-containing protein [Sulfuricurvum sp.]|uniref:PDZ domain-containing protein n=1 Tax=Sulfuricurvum sp. TaxID=2025608 RepID=UPI003BB00314